MMFFLSFFLTFGGLTLTHADLPFLLGEVPLAVKTPYLNAWISNSGIKAPQQVWPTLYLQNRTFGWNGIIRVDSQPYQWFGNSLGINYSTPVTSGITPTKTIFTIQAGPMKFNATFLSPIEPNNYTRQSIPFSYLFVDAFVADDGMPHTVQMYSDISCDWTSYEETTKMTWKTHSLNNMTYHQVGPEKPLSMVDNTGQAEDATAYYATPNRPGLTWVSNSFDVCRGMFSQNGTLNSSEDTNYRISNDARPTFALAIDLGSITPDNQPDPIVWTLGLVRSPIVIYTTESGLQNRTGYYWSVYQNINDVISNFLADFPSARKRAEAFDDHILNTALQVSPEYAGIVTLVTRQIFASMDITIPDGEGGQPTASDVKIFMKDIGMSTRANPVEVIYAALPALLYFNSSIVHDLLLPLFEFQSSSSYTNPYASPDLGSIYPTITGNTSATEDLAIEHCGNMLIMTYAHAVKSGDSSLIFKHHSLLQKWAEYLVQNSLHTNNAVSADGFGYPEMSNLALKGILGIYSMGKIDEVVNPSNTTFKDKADELIAQWKQSAVTDTHIQAQYGKPSTWGLMYNLFPAVWLQTGLIDDDILNREAQFYLSNAPPEDQSYGIDTVQGSDIACPHCALMTAAIIPSSFKPVRDILIKTTYGQANNVTQPFPLPLRYTASTGNRLIGTIASAAQGAVFGIMAMTMPNLDIRTTAAGGSNSTPKGTPKGTPIGAMVGGVIGGFAFLLVVATAVFFWRRRGRRTGVVPGPSNKGYSVLRPFNPQVIQSSSEPQYPMENINHLTPPLVPLASKEREALQQPELHHRQRSTSLVTPTPGDRAIVLESGEGEMLRAEVDGLRREVEAMRNNSEFPPIYQ